MNLHACVVILCFVCFAPMYSKGAWSYTNASSSVDKWGKISNRMCDGARQSPIPLHYDESTYAPNLYPVSVYQLGKFNKSEYLSVMNTGHTLMVFFPSCHYFMSLNGLRNGEFCIKQFHFHWGTDSTSGSEHSLNGRFFPLEMHIVTYNRHLYDSIVEAGDKANGLAVVALFFEEQEDVNLADTQLFKMSAFLRSAEAVQMPNTSVHLTPFPAEALLDVGKDRGRFYRYEGSLTTPPCTENVVWTVMDKVLPVHPQQLEVFRMLHFQSEEAERRMVNNYRKIQTINPATVLVPRIIFRSWNPAPAVATVSTLVCAALFVLTTFAISVA